ncbi:hypothetical protein Tco_1386261 [Tanacetum coccineum]
MLSSSEESVGSHVPRVILFGAIPVIIHVIPEVPVEVPIVPADPLVVPEVGAVSVTSPTGVLDLVDYSSFDSDPSEDSLPPTPDLPLVSPLLCFDDSEADNESELAEQRPERHESLAVHDVMVSRWRNKLPIAPVVAPPGIRQWPSILICLEEAIPFGRPYCTHPNGPRNLLTARKRFGPFPACRIAWRRVSHRSSDRHSSPDFTSDSSSSGSSSESSSNTSLGSPLDSLLDTSSVHSSGCDALESSLDSFSERLLDLSLLSARLSRKRCRSPTTSVPSSTPVSRLIAPTHDDLLPPRKRFKDSYSPKDSREEHMEIGTTDAEVVADLSIGDGAHTEDGIGMGVEIAASDIREDEEEFKAEASTRDTIEMAVDSLVTGGMSESTRGDVPDLEGTLYDLVHYMLKVPFDRITEFETAQRQLEAGQLTASRERAGLTYMFRRFNTSAGNPVKKILLKLNLSDHRLCKMVVECQSVKVKEFEERCNVKAFQELAFAAICKNGGVIAGVLPCRVFLFVLSAFAMVAACASRAAETLSATSFLMAA